MTRKRSTYGQGFVSKERDRFRVFVPDGKGGRRTIGIFDDEAEAYRVKNAALMIREPSVGTTLRQWGLAFLHSIRDHKSIRSTTFTWNSVVCSAPFIDDPLDSIDPPVVCSWAEEELPFTKKKRSVLKNGKRSLVTLDECISRKYAENALGILKLAFDAAKRRGLVSANPAELAKVPADRTVAIDDTLSYLSTDEVSALCGCEMCSQLTGFEPGNEDMLALCPHMPFEQRVIFTLATHQAPREGELAGMDWDRIDWDGHGWRIAQSWEGTTKNRKVRWQALIPRAERLLRKWHELQGKPETGIVFPTPRPSGLGQKRYARGHDWGFADHREKHVTRLGWWRRVGIKTRVRFHDLRDTAATHLLSGSWGPAWSLEQVSKHLGHSSVKVTEARYAHLTRDSKRQAAQSVDSEKPSANSPQVLEARLRKMLAKSRAPEAGLEPTTNRLTALRSRKKSRVVTTFADGLRTVWHPEAERCAVALVERVESGQHARAEAEALALAVLEHPAVTAALSLLADRERLPIPTALGLALLVVSGDSAGLQEAVT